MNCFTICHYFFTKIASIKDKTRVIIIQEMRHGFSLGSLLSISDVQDCLDAMKSREPDAVWIPETWGMENFAMLSVAASRTRTAKIGSSIINIYSRTPSLVGMGAVTVDALSGGRLILGLGASSPQIVSDFHGCGYDDPLGRMREFVNVVRLVMSGRPVDHDGPVFCLHGFRLLLKPCREAVPIYLAAVNRRMMDLAWETGDGVILYLRPRAEMKETIRRMQYGRKIDVACQIITAISEDADAARTRGKKTLAFYIAVGDIYRKFLAENGYRSQADAILEEYRRGGLAGIHNHVDDAMLDDLAACGTPDEVASGISGFVDAGVQMPIMQFNPVGSRSFQLLHKTISDMQ